MDSSKLPPKGFIAANSPEMMPWDTLLNQDVHFCVDRHVVATNDYPAKETRKFDLSTPKHAAWGLITESLRYSSQAPESFMMC
jgi:hypothetical protein